MVWYNLLLALIFAAMMLGGYLWFRKTAAARERRQWILNCARSPEEAACIKPRYPGQVWRFDSLKTLMAKARQPHSGDSLAGDYRHLSRRADGGENGLAEVPLTDILDNPLIPYEQGRSDSPDLDNHDAQGFAAACVTLTVGDFRDWLLDDATDTATLQRVARAITPRWRRRSGKLMRSQDLILAASKCQVVTRCNTIGLPGHSAYACSPTIPTDDPKGIAASILDGLLYGAGDAVIGINPASETATGAGAAERHAGRYYSALRHPNPVPACYPCDQYAAAD